MDFSILEEYQDSRKIEVFDDHGFVENMPFLLFLHFFFFFFFFFFFDEKCELSQKCRQVRGGLKLHSFSTFLKRFQK